MAAEATRWRRPTTLFLLFVSLAGLAFISLRRFGGTTGSLLEDAYHSIGIFTANGSWAFDPSKNVNTLFKVLATVTPVVTFIGFVDLLTGGVLPFIIRHLTIARLRMGARGTVICGLNEQGLEFAKSVRAAGTLVVILDDASQSGLVELSQRRRSPVLPLKTLQNRRLGALLFRQCDLFSFLPSTDQQIDLVARIDTRISQPTDRSFWFLVHERGLAQRLDSYLRFTARHSVLRPRFFDIDALAARHVLATHPLDVLADAADQRQIHIAILGFGALGRAIVKEAARSVITLPSLAGVKLKVSVIDIDAPHAAAALEAEDPQIGQLLELETISLTLPPAGLLATQLHLLPTDVTAYFVAVGNAELAFATAVSLRHWLLEPPSFFGEGWRRTHPCAPIMIRVRNWEGLGRLVRSNVDWPDQALRAPEQPDGIFGFGVSRDVLDPAFIMPPARETGARVLHQSYRNAGEARRLRSGQAEAARVAERAWRELATDLKDLNLYGYDHIPMKARAIGHRIVPGTSSAAMPATALPSLLALSQLEHCRYSAERAAGGWRHARTRSDELRLHPALVAWADLPHSEQLLDENHVQSMFLALSASGQGMQPAFCIAVIGGRQPSANGALAAALTHLLQAEPDSAPVILTALAPGAGMEAAEAAHALKIPWVAALPLPFELYGADFPPAERRQLQGLISFAERYVELPLRFGKASDLAGQDSENLLRRGQQYALATAFILERAHALVVVGDPDEATRDALAWWQDPQAMPDTYRSSSVFMPRPQCRRAPVFLAAG